MMLEAGAEERDLSSVRSVVERAPTRCPTEIAETFQRIGATAARAVRPTAPSGKATFIDGYGMVELGGGAALRVLAPIHAADQRAAPTRCAATSFRVVDDAGNDVPEARSASSPSRARATMRGYHGREEATAEALTAGRLAAHGRPRRKARRFGFFELAGRKKDVIKHGGYSVFAVEVERGHRGAPGGRRGRGRRPARRPQGRGARRRRAAGSRARRRPPTSSIAFCKRAPVRLQGPAADPARRGPAPHRHRQGQQAPPARSVRLTTHR